MSSLLLEIARCPIVDACLQDRDLSHPCAEIVRSQSVQASEHQVPEPWSGQLESAPILFLASNPSISWDEEYPRRNWGNEEIEDFFSSRFGGGRKAWIEGGVRSLLLDGKHGRRATAFWAAIRQRAIELLDVQDVVPGRDYVTAEVVHCKSESERGVREAVAFCVDRYLRRVVEEAAAGLVVCLGVVYE